MSLQLTTTDAKNIAIPHKITPFLEEVTPRWFEKIMENVGIENSTYQINKITKKVEDFNFDVSEYKTIPESNINFDKDPEVIELFSIETLVKVPAKVADINNVPYNQKELQLKLTFEKIFEMKEDLIFYYGIKNNVQYDENKHKYGLLNYVRNHDRMMKETGQIFELNILDKMLSNVWIKPTFFIAHPNILNQIMCQCTENGIYPNQIELFGFSFMTWRGIPIIPCDKLQRKEENKTLYDIFLIRTGENDSGVVILHNNNINYGQTVSSVVKETSTDDKGLISYRVSHYFNVAVLSENSIYMCEF